jgi:hypothetical protein
MHNKFQVISCEGYVFNETFSIDQAEKFFENYNNNCDTILTCLWEVPYYRMCKDWRQGYKNLVQTAKKKLQGKIFIIFDSWYQPYYQDLLDPSVDDILFVDFFATRIYNEVVVKQLCEFKKEFQLKNKFLFLTGKPFKLNRTRLLYKLQQKNLLKNNIWSFYPIDDERNLGHSTVPETTVEEYKNFVEQCKQQPDSVKFVSSGGSWHFNPVPYDIELYNNTDFSIVPESAFNNTHILDNAIVTEKTWIPILNYHAFIIAGIPTSLNKLKAMGFKTFEEYLPIKYDSIIDHEQRLNAIVENVEFLVNNIKTLENNIVRDTEHNYQNFIKLACNNVDNILNFAKKHHWQINQLDDLVKTSDRTL